MYKYIIKKLFLFVSSYFF